MATIVSFHAHPDDETIHGGGTIAKMADEGHRMVVVFATRGEHGEFPADFLQPGEPLWEHRVREAERAAAILGVARFEFLGYVDSGMMGTPTNDAPESFWRADLEEAAGKLAAILADERADALLIYDDNGTYGHPDHIQVHRVGARAGEIAGTPRVLESVMNRDQLLRGIEAAAAGGMELPEEISQGDFEGFGSPEARITHEIDVHPWLERKRSAMAAHASQISDTSFFLTMPRAFFDEGFGTEWFVLRGAKPSVPRHGDLLEP